MTLRRMRLVKKAPNGMSNDERFDRMWELSVETGCHLWLGAKTKYGHGFFCARDESGKHKTVIAHRYSYKRHRGEIPIGMIVCHERSCNNASCVNPWHLYIGTDATNCEDARNAGSHISMRPELSRGEANGRAKLSTGDAEDIRRKYRPGKPYHPGNWRELATIYNVSEATIRSVAKGRSFVS